MFRRGGVSRWDASGLFDELVAGGEQAGRPSARTLLLLYAADLAFRLRREIRPTLAEGRTVIAAKMENSKGVGHNHKTTRRISCCRKSSL